MKNSARTPDTIDISVYPLPMSKYENIVNIFPMHKYFQNILLFHTCKVWRTR